MEDGGNLFNDFFYGVGIIASFAGLIWLLVMYNERQDERRKEERRNKNKNQFSK